MARQARRPGNPLRAAARTPRGSETTTPEGGQAGRRRPAPPAEPDDPSAAFERALKILAAAGQTTARLHMRLRRAGYTEAAVQAALARLTEVGYLDDEAFAASRLRRRLEGGRGRRVIAAELRQRGVPEAVVDSLVSGIDREEELQQATRAAARLVHAHRDDSPAHSRDLVLGALVRRGYPPGLAWEAYKAALAGVEEAAAGA